LIEVLEGYPTQSEIIENGYVYTFKTDGSFTTNKFVLAECESGNYSVTETTLTLIYTCTNLTSGNPPGAFIKNYYFQDDKLILRPSYLNCYEGCEYKFEKL